MLIVPPFASRCKLNSLSAWDASFDHPFVQALIDGSLSTDRFRYYQMQDARYLESYADVCCILATKFTLPSDKLWFIDGAKMALVVEQELHTGYGKQLGYSPQQVAALDITPNNRAYQNHMLTSVSNGSLVKGLGALSPCPWLYTEIGLRIAEIPGGIPLDHPYGKWLSTYSDPVFIQYTNDLLAYLERESLSQGMENQQSAMEAFDLSVKYEWMFWDQAWNMQKWPI
jgi:thiaminase (transcriptional activator TenA)